MATPIRGDLMGVSYAGNAQYDTKFVGNDGVTYDSYEAALAADEIHALATKSAQLTVKSQEQSLENQKALAQMSKDFLAKWSQTNDKTIELLQTAITGGTSTGNAQYDSIVSDIKAQITSFDETYGASMQTSVDAARSNIDLATREASRLAGLATPDYAGVTGKAAADAKTQGAIQAQDAAREAMSYGVDPTSGKFGALTRKNALSTARNTVISMNKARDLEKRRVTETGATAASAANTAAGTATNLATSLMGAKQGLLGLQTDAFKAQTDAERAKADTITSVAGAIGDINSQYGSLGSTLLGLTAA